jgi:hypothetical protein
MLVLAVRPQAIKESLKGPTPIHKNASWTPHPDAAGNPAQTPDKTLILLYFSPILMQKPHKSVGKTASKQRRLPVPKTF